VAGAKILADQISDASEKADAYLSVAKARAKAGDVAGAKDTYEKAKAAAAQITDEVGKESHKDLPDKEMSEALARAGDVVGAKATAAQIDDSRAMKADVYISIVEAEANAGDVAGAITDVRTQFHDPKKRITIFAKSAYELFTHSK
jgi:hypothetical protein